MLQGVAAGHDPVKACCEALAETLAMPDQFRAALQALCLTPDGRHGGASTSAGSTYGVMTASDDDFRLVERGQV